MGQADPREIQFYSQSKNKRQKTDAKGYWEVNLKALEAGGPYQLQITGKDNQISIKDILIGDVWLCSGQSNMQWVVNNVTNAEVEKKNANLPSIPWRRLLPFVFALRIKFVFSPLDQPVPIYE